MKVREEVRDVEKVGEDEERERGKEWRRGEGDEWVALKQPQVAPMGTEARQHRQKWQALEEEEQM